MKYYLLFKMKKFQSKRLLLQALRMKHNSRKYSVYYKIVEKKYKKKLLYILYFN